MHAPSENTKKQITLPHVSTYSLAPPLCIYLTVNLYAHIASRQATILHSRSPHPFPATPFQPRRPQPSAQPSSLIPSGFSSPPISSHPLAPTPSARPRSQARPSPTPSSPHPFPATPLHPRRPQPSAQPSSLIPSGFFSPPISSH